MASIVEQIYEDLKKKIINLDIVPGTKLKEEDLAQEYNISRTPIRSVIARLEKDGLVEVISKKGTYVSKIDSSDMNNLIYIRKSVEMSIFDTLCGKLTNEQIDIINSILNEQKEIISLETSIEKSRRFYDNDNKFHETLFEFAELNRAWEIVSKNATDLNRVRVMANLRDSSHVEAIYDYHVKMINNLIKGNIDEAKRLFAEHLDGGFEGLNKVRERYPSYFL